MKPFFLKEVNTFINPMQISSIYRAADSAHVVMANGSDYNLNEEEYSQLVASFDHKDKHDELDPKIREAIAEAVKEAMNK